MGEGQKEPNINPYLERPAEGRKLGDAMARQIDFLKNFKLAYLLRFCKFFAVGVGVFVLFFVLFVSPGLLTK